MKQNRIKSLFVVAIILTAAIKTGFSQEKEILMPYLKGEKYGYANSKGEIIIEPKYDHALLFKNGYASVRLGYKWGMIKENGDVLFEAIARSVAPFDSNGLSKVNIENRYGVINIKGDWVVPAEFSWIDIKSNCIAVTNSARKSALFDFTGKKIVGFEFDEFKFHKKPSVDSNIIVAKLDGQCGLIRLNKNKFNTLIQPKYEALEVFGKDCFRAKLNDKYGLINSKNETIAPFQFDELSEEEHFVLTEQEIEYEAKIRIVEYETHAPRRPRSEIEKVFDEKNKIAYYLMTQEEKDEITGYGIDLNDRPTIRTLYSLLNKRGQSIIPPQYGQINLEQHFIQAQTDEGITLYNRSGTKVSSLLFEQVDEVKEGLVLVKIRAQIDPKENSTEKLSEQERMIIYYNRFKYGFIDTAGVVVIPLNYNGAFAFNMKRAPVRQADKWALMNQKGEELTKYKYDQLYYAGENRFGFRVGKRWGLLDLNGVEIIPATYYGDEKAEHNTDRSGGYSGLVFKNGKAITSKQIPGFGLSRNTMIDANGVQLFPFKYRTVEEQDGGLFKVSVRNHDHDRDSYGLIDRSGNVMLPVYQNNVWWLENEKVFIVSRRAFQNDYSYYNAKGTKVDSPYKVFENEKFRDYKMLDNGYFSAKYKHFTVYFTPSGLPLFDE